MAYEYSVIPAPKKGLKARGVRSAEDRFANAMQTIMNEKGAEGWDYVRTDTLPADERTGLTGSKTVYQNMMVFRRALSPAAEAPTALLEAPRAEPEPVEDAVIPPLPRFSAHEDRLVVAGEDDPLIADPKLRAD